MNLTVLDLTRLLPGATATAYFVRHGAEVIKIEQPGDGDYARALDPETFQATNAGKKSLAINLKEPRGREVFLRLAAGADILIEGFRPGTMARLGLGYGDLRTGNPRLVYASLTGYGQTGPFAELAGHDVNYIALGGLLGLNQPVIPGVQIADLAGGSMQAVIAILFALLERERTGVGCYLDVSMLAGVEALLTISLAAYRRTGRDPEPGGEVLSGRYACYNVYEAADGRWLAVGALEPKFWAELCRRIGCEDLIALQFAEGDVRGKAKERLASIFKTRPAAAWFEELRRSDCCVTPVRTMSEVAAETGSEERLPAPALGEHSGEVLAAAGLTQAEIELLVEDGVVE